LRERLVALAEDTSGLEQLRWEAAKADERGLDLEEWLAELLSWLQDSAQPSKAPAQGVELITTHSAKGLEWEWVIPIGFRKRFSHRNERYPRIQSEENCHVVWSNLSRRAKRDEEAAKIHIKRLLYVMLTRAKTGLIIPTPEGAYNPGKQNRPRRLSQPVGDDGYLPLPNRFSLRLNRHVWCDLTNSPMIHWFCISSSRKRRERMTTESGGIPGLRCFPGVTRSNNGRAMGKIRYCRFLFANVRKKRSQRC
jgi:ATP-dependent exoDNAse (exonuclease V) beta subunit